MSPPLMLACLLASLLHAPAGSGSDRVDCLRSPSRAVDAQLPILHSVSPIKGLGLPTASAAYPPSRCPFGHSLHRHPPRRSSACDLCPPGAARRDHPSAAP